MKKQIMSLVLALVMVLGIFPVSAHAESSESKLAAITFDDGPSKYTDGLLDELAKRDVVVTFFMQGCNAEAYPSVVKKAYEAGHQIASHSYNHPQLTKLTDARIRDQLTKTENILNKAIGADISYMLRPPYGSTNDRVLAAIGTPAINWSVDTRDWESRNADKVYNHIVNDTKDGSIVLLHDLYPTSVSGALRGIDTLLEQGYELVTVEELLRRRGVEAADGKMYYSARGDSTLPGIAQPVISTAGTAGGWIVTLSADAGTTIYYTTDGTAPTSQSMVYNGPFLLEGGAAVKAFAARDLNGGRSRVAEAKLEQPLCKAPVITMRDGLASISGEGDVYYTLDGSMPAVGAARYTGPLAVSAGTMIRAVAVEMGYGSSAVTSLLYSNLGNLFSDIEPSKWYYQDVDSAVSLGLMTASGTEFRPDAPSTRRDVVLALYGLAGRPGSHIAASFSDVTHSDPAHDALIWAVEQHILSGFDDGTLRPDEVVTREQLAVMLYRVQAENLDSREIPVILRTFSDADSIHGYAVDAVSWAVFRGIMNGVSDSAFSPGGTVSRAQLASIVLRCQPVVETERPGWI